MGWRDDPIIEPAPPQARSWRDDEIVAPDPETWLEWGLGVGEDIGMSALHGLAQGGHYAAGLAGDTLAVMDTGVDWLDEAVFGEKTPEEQARRDATRARFRPAPTTGEVQEFLGYEGYEPKTFVGDLVMEGASYAVPTGITGKTQQLGKRVFQYGVAPGVIAETAGQVAAEYGPEWAEPYVRLASSLLTAATPQAMKARSPKPQAASIDDLKNRTRQLHKEVESKGVMIEPDAYDDMVEGILDRLDEGGLHPEITPKAAGAFRSLYNAKGVGKNIKDMTNLRQIANNVLSDLDKNERRLAREIVDGIDDFLADLRQTDLIAGDASEIAPILKNARKNWHMAMKGEIIEEVVYKARNAVGANYTAAGMDTALRQKFRVLADNKKLMQKFSPDEQKAILQVVRGDKLQNALRYLGKLAPTGVISATLGGGAGHAVAGWPGTAAVLGPGLAARHASSKMGVGKANRVSDMVRGGRLPVLMPPIGDPQSVLPMLPSYAQRAQPRPLELTVQPDMATVPRSQWPPIGPDGLRVAPMPVGQ